MIYTYDLNFQGSVEDVPHQQQQNVICGRNENSNSPLFPTPTKDDNDDCSTINQEVNNKHSNDNKNTSNRQMLHSIASASNNNVTHNQISSASNVTFNRTIGSRQSSPTNDEVNNLNNTIQLSEKLNSVNLSNVQNSSVQTSVTKEASLIPATGQVASENQQPSASSAPTQQINIDTSSFPGQVDITFDRTILYLDTENL